VINCIIGDEEVWKRIERMEIESRMDSNHFPLVIEKGKRIWRGGSKKIKKWI